MGTATSYDWYYTAASFYSQLHMATISRIDIPVTSALAQIGSGSPQRYSIVFSCDVVASGIWGGAYGPQFWVFSNNTGVAAANTYGGGGVPYFVPLGGVPIPTGGDNNPGSIVSPANSARYLTPTVTSITSYSAPFQIAGTISMPNAGQLLLGSTLTIGIALFTEQNNYTSTVGSVSLTNIQFTATPL
tara:strand:+ start:137 stop:700 length:564 start_codon:yes stop_codon:yes gene_type:complete